LGASGTHPRAGAAQEGTTNFMPSIGGLIGSVFQIKCFYCFCFIKEEKQEPNKDQMKQHNFFSL
jgi:hypothetical protein